MDGNIILGTEIQQNQNQPSWLRRAPVFPATAARPNIGPEGASAVRRATEKAHQLQLVMNIVVAMEHLPAPRDVAQYQTWETSPAVKHQMRPDKGCLTIALA